MPVAWLFKNFLSNVGFTKELENSTEFPQTLDSASPNVNILHVHSIITKTKKLTFWCSTVNYILFYL